MAGNVDKYEQLSAWLDGELSPAERTEVDRLLATDAEARRILNELRQTSDLLRGLPRQRLPAAASSVVTARLERESLLGQSNDSIRPTAWWKPLALAAAILIVCGVTYEGFVKLQDYRERRVFQLADAEYAKTEAPRPQAAAPPPLPTAGTIAVRRELSPNATPLAKDQIRIDKSAPRDFDGAMMKKLDEQKSEKAPRKAPIFGAMPEQPAAAPAGAEARPRAATGFATETNTNVLAKMRRPPTSQPTSQPTTSRPAKPTSQPVTKRSSNG